VGPKLALRILTELREKAGGMPGGATLAAPMVARGAVADALSALVNLGYRRAEAEAALAKAAEAHGADAALDVLIRAGLKGLAR
jgi:Holliday junction DNA helicase RuvA